MPSDSHTQTSQNAIIRVYNQIYYNALDKELYLKKIKKLNVMFP